MKVACEMQETEPEDTNNNRSKCKAMDESAFTWQQKILCCQGSREAFTFTLAMQGGIQKKSTCCEIGILPGSAVYGREIFAHDYWILLS